MPDSKMKKFAQLLIFSMVVVACGSKQQKQTPPETIEKDSIKTAATSELGMWKIANYASNLGDNKDKSYITNAYAIWGTFTNKSNDKAELKVKFLVDRETFCIKLLEFGTKAVKKGDEKLYKIKVISSANEVVEFTARNVSDRLFIASADAQKIYELFGKGGLISFYMASDSKTAPATYSFTVNNPEGIERALLQISK